MASQYNLNTRTQNRSFRNWILCFASGISIAALTPYALAQDDVDDTVETTSDVVEDAQNELDTITVVGTRLEGVSPASPVLMVTRDEIDARGLSSVEDVLRYVPQNFSTVTSGGIADGTVDGSGIRNEAGVATVNLRGLGEGSTLVLVNGKRISASASTSGTFTDISTIPFGAIERVEVLTDGASAIYGSDAVGGVINFILRDDYAGSKTNVRYEHSSSGGHLRRVDQTLGFGWGSGNVIANVSFEEQDPVNRFDAGLTDIRDYTNLGGRDFSSTVRFRQTGQPISRDPVFVRDLTPENEQFSGYLNVTQSLSESVSVNLSAQYSDRESSVVRIGHPFQAVVRPPGGLYFPNPGAPFAIARYSFQAEVDRGDLAPASLTSTSERYSLNGTLDWEMPYKDWQLSLGLGMSSDETESAVFGIDPEDQNVIDAIQSTDPATALNVFGDGSIQRDNLNALITRQEDGTRRGEQEFVTMNLRGSAFSLPQGDVSFSVGAELRNDVINYEDYRLNPIGAPNPSLVDFVPEIENQTAYFELNVPLVSKESNLSLMEELSVQLAGRYDNYDLDGPFDGLDTSNPSAPPVPFPNTSRSFDDFVPKVGVVWRVNESLKLRGTWGEAFQIPSIPELFEPPVIDDFIFAQQCYSDPTDPRPGGEFPCDFFGPGTFAVPLVAGGNPDLQPQTSESLTLGADITPSAIEDLDINLTYSKTEFEGRISAIFDVFQAADIFGPAPTPIVNSDQYPGIVERNDQGQLIFFDPARPYNLSSRTSETLDFNVRKGFDTELGLFEVGTLGTYIISLEDTPAPGVDPVEQAGTDRGPSEWTLRTYVDWSKDNWRASAIVNHSSGYDNTDIEANIPTVDGYTTFDLNATYTLADKGWKFSAGVNNLFDEDFPFIDNRDGVDSRRVDFRRRVFFIDITKEFDF